MTNFPIKITLDKKLQLEAFQELLLKWNKQFNLVAKSTLPDMWERHFVDSLQLAEFLPQEPQSILDLGSGAGFPAIPLAICTTHNFTLTDYILKKTTFLNMVKANLYLDNITIYHGKIEQIFEKKYDIIMSRALGSLIQLLEYAETLLNQSGYCLFLKGENFDQELKEAQANWHIDFELNSSITNKKAVIVKIINFERLL